MTATDARIPAGPIEGSRWSIEPITHTLRFQGSEYCLRVRTGFLRLMLTFFLGILLFFPLSFVISDGWVALGIAVATAFGLTLPLLRIYRSLFCEVTFDLSRNVVQLRRRGRTDTFDLPRVVEFQVCQCTDKKETGFIRYHNEFHQLILVYEDGGAFRRRLITSSTCGEIDRLLNRLREHVQIGVHYYTDRRTP